MGHFYSSWSPTLGLVACQDGHAHCELPHSPSVKLVGLSNPLRFLLSTLACSVLGPGDTVL